MTKITLDLLKNMPSEDSACDEALEWFEATFPSGTDLQTAWNACDNDSWRIWFACNYLPPAERQALAFRFAGQAFRYAAKHEPELAQYEDNVTLDNWQEARDAAVTTCAAAAAAARAAAAAAAYYAAANYAAAAAPAAARAASVNVHARAEQARWCAAALGLGE